MYPTFLVIVSLICHILGWFDFFRPSCRLDIRYKIGHWSELVTKRFRVRILGKKSIIFQGLNKLYFYLQNILVNNSKKPLKSLKLKKQMNKWKNKWKKILGRTWTLDNKIQLTKLSFKLKNVFCKQWSGTLKKFKNEKKNPRWDSNPWQQNLILPQKLN